MFSFKEMVVPQSASAVFSAYASFATTIMLIRSITNELLPAQFLSFFSTIFFYFLGGSISSHTKFVIDENSGLFHLNQVFQAAQIYLPTKITPSIQTLRVTKTPQQNRIMLSIDKDQEIIDYFNNIRLRWRFVCFQDERDVSNPEKHYFELLFPTKFRDAVVDFYLPYVLRRAEQIREEDKVVKIYSQQCEVYDYSNPGPKCWGSIILDHPATFETVAMDPDLKQWIIDDLDRFLRRKDFYKKVGKAWKRGYLLYGPPGTGKSSLIAAIANYLKFDIYDLDLASVYTNTILRRLLLATKNRSILVIEDIDCSANIQNRQSEEHFDASNSNSKLTLSGMLNLIDGLWSSCGDERIIIFTTNHKERLDPALLRPGRMDVHINMSYCSPEGFKVLASNYLGSESVEHRLYGEIEELIGDVEVSPAEIAEELMKSDEADAVLEGLVVFLKRKGEEQRKAKEEKESEKNEEREEQEEMEKTETEEEEGEEEEEEAKEEKEEEEPKKVKWDMRIRRTGRGRRI